MANIICPLDFSFNSPTKIEENHGILVIVPYFPNMSRYQTDFFSPREASARAPGTPTSPPQPKPPWRQPWDARSSSISSVRWRDSK